MSISILKSASLAKSVQWLIKSCSYNKYLSVAASVVRRSLKDTQRLAAEKRGVSELRFAKWNVSTPLGCREGSAVWVM